MDLSGIGSLYTDQMSQAASNASGDNLKAKLNNSSNATDDELMEVCKEFEAYMEIAKDTANEGNGVGLAQSLYEQMRRNYEQ